MASFAYGQRPQVLLLGNGINRCFGGNSWQSLIKTIALRNDLPEELACPLPLQAVLATNNRVNEAILNHKAELYGTVPPSLRAQMITLLSMGFDDILTTNYSYELEAAAEGKSRITDSALRKNSANILDGQRVEQKYLLRSYQRVSCGQRINRVWHIHGEARKPGSLILSQYSYAAQIHKMREFVVERRDSYQRNQKQQKPQTVNGWLDSFLLGDVYILGFGMDYSETDIWWLLERKKRERAEHGDVYYYTPESTGFQEKEELLTLLGVKVLHCDLPVPTGTEQQINAGYQAFYTRAMEDIRLKMNKE